MHVGVGGWGVLARLEYNLHWSPRKGAPITVLAHPLGPKDDHLCALRMPLAHCLRHNTQINYWVQPPMQVSVGQECGNMIIVKQSIRVRRMMPKRAAASRNPREFFL